MESDITKLSENELIEIIKKLANYEEVSSALLELKNRKNKSYIDYAYEILNKRLGDEHLQGFAFYLLYSGAPKKSIDFLENNLTNLSLSIIDEAIGCLCEDSEQIIEQKLYRPLIKRIYDHFEKLNDNRKSNYDNYEWFKETFIT